MHEFVNVPGLSATIKQRATVAQSCCPRPAFSVRIDEKSREVMEVWVAEGSLIGFACWATIRWQAT